MLTLAFVLAAGTFLANPVPVELNAYVRRPDVSYQWHVAAPVRGHKVLSLTSQAWHGVPWRHSVVISPAGSPLATDAAIIYITGDEPNPSDIGDADTVSWQSSLPVAMLYNIPVQPIGGLQEDELIAHTFEEFLKTGDATWPLLFPMAKSVIRTMDALTAWSHGRLKRFVLMGESKRAWTAWMAAATGDRRIVGIAPCAYDNLNVAAQMKHQMAIWGHYSPAIEAYTKRGLQAALSTAAGKRLGRMVDPYSYLPTIKARILTVRGSNDPYWAQDAYSLYRARLPRGSSLLILPNEGHDFKDKHRYFETVGAFAASCALKARWPGLNVHIDRYRVTVAGNLPLDAAAGYSANSRSLNFQGFRWQPVKTRRSAGKHEIKFTLPIPSSQYQEVLVQVNFKVKFGTLRRTVTLSTPIIIRHVSQRSSGTDYDLGPVSAITTLPMPPRTLNRPVTRIHRGEQAADNSSSSRFTTAS